MVICIFTLARLLAGSQQRSETDDDINVYFDNLTITHTVLQVVEQTDYYPYGMVMRKEIPSQGQGIYNPYRYGYQGQFAEKDEETGWNHFELRQYGSRIGRWTATDPYRQYYSPYVGMGNNPINGVDPDGGYTKFGAKWRAFWTRGVSMSDVYSDKNGEYGFNTSSYGGAIAFDGMRYDYYNTTFNYGRTYENTENTSVRWDNNYYSDLRKYSTGLDYWKAVGKSGDAYFRDKNSGFSIGARTFAGFLPPVSIFNAVLVLSTGNDIYDNKATKLDKSLAIVDLAVTSVTGLSVTGVINMAPDVILTIKLMNGSVQAVHGTKRID